MGSILLPENVRGMSEVLPPDLPGGLAGALGTLRHALADPLSAAGLKLELLERRLAAVPPDGTSLVDRVRGTMADLAVAGRLIDLLPRLAAIAAESPRETSIDDLCRVVGLPLDPEPVPHLRLPMRRLASADALRIVAALLRSLDRGGMPPRVRVEAAPQRLSLRLEAQAGCPANPERLFQLPRGEERAGELFLARAGIESDGGSLELTEREGVLVALLSWPRPVGGGGAPA